MISTDSNGYEYIQTVIIFFYRMVVMVLLFASSDNTTKDFHTTTKLLDLRVMFHYVIPSIELWLKSLSGWCFLLFDLRILVFRTPSKLHWGFWWAFLCALHNHFRLWNANGLWQASVISIIDEEAYIFRKILVNYWLTKIEQSSKNGIQSVYLVCLELITTEQGPANCQYISWDTTFICSRTWILICLHISNIDTDDVVGMLWIVMEYMKDCSFLITPHTHHTRS